MIAFDLAYELTLGAFCAGLCPRSRRITVEEPSFRHGLLVSSLLYVPSCVAGLAAWPAWQTMYVLDVGTPQVLALIGALQSAALVGLYVLGFALGGWAISGGRARRLAASFAVGWPSLLATLFGLLWRRAFTITTYDDFWSAGRRFTVAWGGPQAMLGGPVMAFLLVAGAANAVAIAVLAGCHRRVTESVLPQGVDGQERA